jgi:hypothetical protein
VGEFPEELCLGDRAEHLANEEAASERTGCGTTSGSATASKKAAQR